MIVVEEGLLVLRFVEAFILIWCVFFATGFVFVLLGKGVM